MRVYIAGQYGRKYEFREYAKQLQEKGIQVGADWLKESEAPTSKLNEVKETLLSQYAMKDWWDIGACDVFVFFTEPQEQQPPRGGRHVEFGIALALGKPIVVIGEHENIFHYMPGFKLEHFDTWESALVFLQMLDDDFYTILNGMWD